MSTTIPRAILEVKYFQEAQTYLRNLPPEHFMESRTQARQRAIFGASLDLVHAARSDIQPFSEMLVQYERGRRKSWARWSPTT